MMIELFPTVWDAAALLVAGAVCVLAVGIWLGKVNADRSSFKEFMSQIRQELDQSRKDMN